MEESKVYVIPIANTTQNTNEKKKHTNKIYK